MTNTAAEAWRAGEARKQNLLRRCQTYAGFTLPHICTPDGYDEQSAELQTDWQALGAQAVNNLSNKLILALFAPSRPFFRLDVPAEILAAIEAEASGEDIQGKLAMAEKKAVRRLENMGVRPKIYEAVKHLAITGNCLLILGKKDDTPMRVLGLKRYCVKRSMSGKVIQIVIHEKVRFDELDKAVRDELKTQTKYAACDVNDPNSCFEVSYYKLIQWDGISNYLESVEIDDHRLGKEFTSKYTDATLPYRALTWELCDDNDYGTGLVEQFSGDFAALSALSEAQIKAAILASEFRWLVNPAGQTSPVDLENSDNGAALPGVKDDIVPLVTGTGQTLQHIDVIENKYVNRIGRGFLLGSSVIRQAERVTAEEVRLQANELETSLGGVYSRLAVDFQLPIAHWLIKMADVDLGGTDIEPTVLTGLDALSRNSDLEALKLCLQDLAIIGGMSPQTQFVLRMDAIASAIFAGRGVDAAAYVKTPAQQEAELKNQQAMQLAQQVARPVASAVVNGGGPA